MRKLAVLFPGLGYTIDAPLLYYASFKNELLGYDLHIVQYNHILKQDKSINEKMNELVALILEELNEKEVLKYDEVLFFSKSIDTCLA